MWTIGHRIATYPPTLRSIWDNELGNMLWSFAFRILFLLGVKEIDLLALFKIFTFFTLALNSKLGPAIYGAGTCPILGRTYPDWNCFQRNDIFHFKIEILASVSIVAVLNLSRLSGWSWFWHSQDYALVAILVVQIGLEFEHERTGTKFFNFCHFKIIWTIAVKFKLNFFIILQV